MNGHIIESRLQTQKFYSPYKTPSNTLAVKGLMIKLVNNECDALAS